MSSQDSTACTAASRICRSEERRHASTIRRRTSASSTDTRPIKRTMDACSELEAACRLAVASSSAPWTDRTSAMSISPACEMPSSTGSASMAEARVANCRGNLSGSSQLPSSRMTTLSIRSLPVISIPSLSGPAGGCLRDPFETPAVGREVSWVGVSQCSDDLRTSASSIRGFCRRVGDIVWFSPTRRSFPCLDRGSMSPCKIRKLGRLP